MSGLDIAVAVVHLLLIAGLAVVGLWTPEPHVLDAVREAMPR